MLYRTTDGLYFVNETLVTEYCDMVGQSYDEISIENQIPKVQNYVKLVVKYNVESLRDELPVDQEEIRKRYKDDHDYLLKFSRENNLSIKRCIDFSLVNKTETNKWCITQEGKNITSIGYIFYLNFCSYPGQDKVSVNSVKPIINLISTYLFNYMMFGESKSINDCLSIKLLDFLGYRVCKNLLFIQRHRFFNRTVYGYHQFQSENLLFVPEFSDKYDTKVKVKFKKNTLFVRYSYIDSHLIKDCIDNTNIIFTNFVEEKLFHNKYTCLMDFYKISQIVNKKQTFEEFRTELKGKLKKGLGKKI